MNAETLSATIAEMLAAGKVERRYQLTKTKPAEEWRLTPE
jgi:hypothetical protein